MTKFEVKSVEAKALGMIFEDVQRSAENIIATYEEDGYEDTQATSYRTGELLWEDDEHTIPKYRVKYSRRLRNLNELPEDEQIQYATYMKVLAAIEKML